VTAVVAGAGVSEMRFFHRQLCQGTVACRNQFLDTTPPEPFGNVTAATGAEA
jgi:hypothetical protein